MSKKIDLSIIVPCFNEEENVELILNDIKKIISKQKFISEIILVDDQSEDNTLQIAKKWKKENKNIIPISVIQRPLSRRGYGAVVRWGAAYSKGKYCIFVAADRVDSINLLPKMFQEMQKGATVVQVSRYLKKGNNVNIPFKYRFYQFLFRFFVKLIFHKLIADSTYAFKMFNRNEILGVGLSQNRFSISPEITFKCLLMNKKIIYIPSSQGSRTNGVSKFNFWREGPGYVYCLIRALAHKYNIFYWF